MALSDAESIYKYYMDLPLPEQWKTPASLKKSYENVLSAANLYQKQIDSQMKDFGSIQPATATPEYRNLLALYNDQYQKGAAAAAAEAVKASQGMNAGYGDTYSRAATDQAYTSFMADRGAAVPSLLAAASDAYYAGKNAQAASINQKLKQRNLRTDALRSLFNSQLTGIQKETESRREALSTQQTALANLLSYQQGIEKAAAAAAAARASSGGSGGSGGGSQYYVSQQEEEQKNSNNNHQSLDGRRKDAWTIYDNAIKIYPGLKGKLAPPGHSRNSGNFMDGYANYVQKQINIHKQNISARRK